MAFKSLKIKFNDRLNNRLFTEGTFENQLDLIALYVLENRERKNIFKNLFEQFDDLNNRQKIQYYEVFCNLIVEENIVIGKILFMRITRNLLRIEYLREKILKFLKELISLKYYFLVGIYYENISHGKYHIEYVGFDNILRHQYEISSNFHYLRFFHKNNIKFDLCLNLFKNMRKEQLIAILRYAIKYAITIENINMRIMKFEELKYLLIEYNIIHKKEVSGLINKYFDEQVLNILDQYSHRVDDVRIIYKLKNYEDMRKYIRILNNWKYLKSIVY